MAERRKSKGSKGNEREEGTDGSKQKGGGGGGGRESHQQQPHQKKTGIAGGARFVYKRVTGKPKSSSIAKESEDKSEDKYFTAPPFPEAQQESPQQQQGSQWDSWENTPHEPSDPVQPVASASEIVVLSTETESDDIVLPTEGATPPTPMKYITTDANVSIFNICMCLLCVN